jgi:AraC-like DNA-binding protein
LQKLFEIVEYLPFHFQKIFKQIVGETPKQYAIRIRIETAAHALIIRQDKKIDALKRKYRKINDHNLVEFCYALKYGLNAMIYMYSQSLI